MRNAITTSIAIVLLAYSAQTCYGRKCFVDVKVFGNCPGYQNASELIQDCPGSCGSVETEYPDCRTVEKMCEQKQNENKCTDAIQNGAKRKTCFCNSDYCNTGAVASPTWLLLISVSLVLLILGNVFKDD